MANKLQDLSATPVITDVWQSITATTPDPVSLIDSVGQSCYTASPQKKTQMNAQVRDFQFCYSMMVWSWVLRFVELPKLLQTDKFQFVSAYCCCLRNTKELKLPTHKFTAFSSQAFMGMFIRITCPSSVACCLSLSPTAEVSTAAWNEVVPLFSSSLTFKGILIQANASFNISHTTGIINYEIIVLSISKGWKYRVTIFTLPFERDAFSPLVMSSDLFLISVSFKSMLCIQKCGSSGAVPHPYGKTN